MTNNDDMFMMMEDDDNDNSNNNSTNTTSTSPTIGLAVNSTTATSAATTTATTTSAAAATANAANLAASLPPNRFELELEFLQSLASPAYLHYLATAPEKYLQDPQFMAFLRYLKYWQRPEYARLISYPHALYMLDLLLQSQEDADDNDDKQLEGSATTTTTTDHTAAADGEQPPTTTAAPTNTASAPPSTGVNLVARELVNVSFRNFIHQQQYYSWQYRALHLYGGASSDNSHDPTEGSSSAAEGPPVTNVTTSN